MTSGGLIAEYAYLSDALNQGRLLLLTRAVSRVVNIELLGPRQTKAGFRIVLDVATAPPSAPWQTRFGFVPWATRLIAANQGLPPGPMHSFVLHRLYRDVPTQVRQQIRPAPATRQAVPQLAPAVPRQLGAVQPQPRVQDPAGRQLATARTPRGEPIVASGQARPTGTTQTTVGPAASPGPGVSDLSYSGPGSASATVGPPVPVGQSSQRLRQAVADATGRTRAPVGIDTAAGAGTDGATVAPVEPLAPLPGNPAPATAQLPPELLFPEGEDDFDLDLADYGGGEAIDDPLEGVNRVIFAANDFLDRAIFRPVAWVYGKVTPEPLQDGLSNAFENLKAPVVVANDLFQLEFERAATNVGRFVINSTVGVAGMWDAAEAFGLKEVARSDFGQTLHSYGVGSGPYLILPLIGPTNLRDFGGSTVDGFIHPFTWVLDPTVRGGLSVGEGVSVREAVLGPVDELRESSLDYYAAIRSFYWQNRQTELEAASGFR